MKKYFYIFCSLFFILIACKPTVYSLKAIEGKQLNVGSELKEKYEINDYLSPFKRHLNKYLSKVLAVNKQHLGKQITALNMPIGNFMADAAYEQANPLYFSLKRRNIDFALFNWGGIRTEVPAGDITTRTAYELMPFENRFLVVELSGNRLYEMAKFLISNKMPHPLSKHIELAFDSKDNIKIFKIGGKKIQRSKKYSVLTSDYLAKGGDKMTFFLNPISVIDLDYEFRDALIDYFKRVDEIKARTDNRFKQLK